MKIKFFIVTIIFLCFSGCDYGGKISQGNEIAAKIEKFQIENKRLPNSLSVIGIRETESGPIYYKRKNETEYILWFGKDLGESMTYDSQTRQWK